jgi:site-specific DNA recombinase
LAPDSHSSRFFDGDCCGATSFTESGLSITWKPLTGVPAEPNPVGCRVRKLQKDPAIEQQLGQLQEALAKGVRDGDSDAADAIRELAETVTVFRDPSRPGGVEVEIAGQLTALLGETAFPNGVNGERW